MHSSRQLGRAVPTGTLEPEAMTATTTGGTEVALRIQVCPKGLYLQVCSGDGI